MIFYAVVWGFAEKNKRKNSLKTVESTKKAFHTTGNRVTRDERVRGFETHSLRQI